MVGDLRDYAWGWTEEHFLSTSYSGPGYLNDDELRTVFEIGYRAYTWCHDVSPYEAASAAEIMDYMPRGVHSHA